MKKNLKAIYLFFIFAVLTVLDQASKYWASHNLMESPKVLIKNIFELHYLENKGAAWGILSGHISFFTIITAIIIILIGILIFRMSKFIGKKYTICQYVLVILLSGAVGNLIDRVVNGYVVDFFYFKLIDFPIFNVADCYVTCSVAALLIIMLFVFKEDELEALFKFKKRNED